MHLPSPIEAYFDADRRNDVGALTQCFAPAAVVVDEGRTYAGPEAIGRWWRAAKDKYQHVVEPLESEATADGAKVIGKVTGNFPGGVANLTFAFRLEGGEIAGLEIAP